MTKTALKLALALFATGLFASGAYAAPVSLNDTQMDSVAAGVAPTPTGFVCPVIPTDAIANDGAGGFQLGATDYYSIEGPMVMVPDGATNDNGDGSPGGAFVAPGSTDYTAIWDTVD